VVGERRGEPIVDRPEQLGGLPRKRAVRSWRASGGPSSATRRASVTSTLSRACHPSGALLHVPIGSVLEATGGLLDG